MIGVLVELFWRGCLWALKTGELICGGDLNWSRNTRVNDDRSFLTSGVNPNSFLGKFQNPSTVMQAGANQYHLFNQCE